MGKGLPGPSGLWLVAGGTAFLIGFLLDMVHTPFGAVTTATQGVGIFSMILGGFDMIAEKYL